MTRQGKARTIVLVLLGAIMGYHEANQFIHVISTLYVWVATGGLVLFAFLGRFLSKLFHEMTGEEPETESEA
jgi:hypothetical protein